MDLVDFSTYMYKLLREREQDIASSLAHDAAKDWEHYKEEDIMTYRNQSFSSPVTGTCSFSQS